MTAHKGARAGTVPWRGLWRQSRMDAGPLGVGLVVIAAAAFLSAVVPQATAVVERAEIRNAVSAPDARVDVVVTVPMAGAQGETYELAVGTADAAQTVRDLVDNGVPPELHAVLKPPVTALVSQELKAGSIAGRPGRVSFIYVASEGGPAVEWVTGRAPGSTGTPDDLYTSETGLLPIEVAVSEAAAAVMEIHAGDPLTVDNPDGLPLDVTVTGIYRAGDPDDAAWRVAPTLLQPTLVDGSAPVADIGLMVSEASVPFARLAVFPHPMTRTYTFAVVPSAFANADAATVRTEARGLASGKESVASLGSDVRVRTELDRVLDAAFARVDAASAQASVLLIGLLCVALAVQLLAARLVIERRAVVLSQWRLRGATLAAVGAASAGESVPLASLGGLFGALAARYATHGETPWAWLLPPLIVAALAPPVMAVWAAGTHGSPTRQTLGRHPGFSPARVRRLAAEALLMVAAVGTLATLRMRGVTASAGSVWTDIAVLAAPVLVSLALVVVMVRMQPRVLDAARTLAARSRGAVPLLAAARTRAGGTATAALVTAGAIAAISSSLAITVSHAQVAAAWDAVGADVAVATDAETGLPDAITALDGTHGLTVATSTLVTGAQVIGAKVDDRVEIAVIDADAMTRLLAATPGTDGRKGDTGNFDALTRDGLAADGAVPVMVLGATEAWKGVTMRWGRESVPVVAVGRASSLPAQITSDTLTVVVDRATLAAALGHDIPATRAWLVGPDAGDIAIATVVDENVVDDTTVVTREGWLADHRAAPVTRALGWLFLGAGAAAAVLAVLAVMLMAASGSWERTRATARMRVVGASRGAARRVAWLEVAIPAVVSSAAGVLAGFWLAHLLVVALDLVSVTGGRAAPPLIVPWWLMALALLLSLIAWAGLALANLSHGRERLGALMRVG